MNKTKEVESFKSSSSHQAASTTPNLANQPQHPLSPPWLSFFWCPFLTPLVASIAHVIETRLLGASVSSGNTSAATFHGTNQTCRAESNDQKWDLTHWGWKKTVGKWVDLKTWGEVQLKYYNMYNPITGRGPLCGLVFRVFWGLGGWVKKRGSILIHGKTLQACEFQDKTEQKLVFSVQINNLDVSKNRGKNPEMDGENNGKTLLKWMIWGYHYFWKHPFTTYTPWN